MILGLDISTSITGATVLSNDGKVVFNEAWDFRNKKYFPTLFHKGREIKELLRQVDDEFYISSVFIEQSLQSFRSGFSSAKTLSTLSRFNGIVSWLCYEVFELQPEYVAATSARKKCGIKIPKGVKAKQVVIQYVLDNVPSVLIEYTKHGNPKPHCFDKADSWVIANAGYLCQMEKSAQS
tara:strand:- start:1968 stop:2507 length:540 start_codon:yes stop_codon:yes gene_type:complete